MSRESISGDSRLGCMTVYSAKMSLQYDDWRTSDRQSTYDKCVKDSKGEVKFSLKALVTKGSAEILYKTPISLYARAVLTVVDPKKTIASTEHALIPANTWQHFTTIKESELDFVNGQSKLFLKILFFVMDDKVKDTLSPFARLSNDLGSLLDRGVFTDVILKSCDGVKHKAHKIILSRSPVLRAALEHGTKEKKTDVINSPFESAVLEQVLKFIYTDQAPGISEMGAQLLAAADYYQLDLLKCLCEQVLYEQLTTENCLESLQIADKHSAPVLKNIILQYINERAEDLISIESWKNLQKTDLIKVMYEAIAVKNAANKKNTVKNKKRNSYGYYDDYIFYWHDNDSD